MITNVTYKSDQSVHARAGQYISVSGVSLSDDGGIFGGRRDRWRTVQHPCWRNSDKDLDWPRIERSHVCVCLCLIGIWMMSSLHSRWLQRSHPFLQSMSPITCFSALLSLHSHQSNHDLLTGSRVHFSLSCGQNILRANSLKSNVPTEDGMSALLDNQSFFIRNCALVISQVQSVLLCHDLLIWT